MISEATAVHGSFGFYNRADRSASYPDCNGTYEEQKTEKYAGRTDRRVSINPQGSLGWSTSFIQYGLRAIGYLRLVLYTKKNPE